MSGSSNVLAREFLSHVHQLCSEDPMGEGEDGVGPMVALGSYLVQGRGFHLLTALNSAIDQELTCRQELLALLLSLLPLVWKIPVEYEKAQSCSLPPLVEVLGLEENLASQSFDCKFSSKNKKLSSAHKSRSPGTAAERPTVKASSSDSDTQPMDSVSQRRRVRRSRDERMLKSPQLPLSTTQTCSVVEVVHVDPTPLLKESREERSPFDLCHILLSLVCKVAQFDGAIGHNIGPASVVVNTLFELLVESADCKAELGFGWTEEPLAFVQRMMLRTIHNLMSIEFSQREDPAEELRKNFMMLLRTTDRFKHLVEKVQVPGGLQKKVPRPSRTSEEDLHQVFLVPELLQLALHILLCCLKLCTSKLFVFSHSVDLVHQFVQNGGLQLFQTSILRLVGVRCLDVGDEAKIECLVQGLVAGVMEIMVVVKKAKCKQLHHTVCTRRRHRHCERSPALLHHHLDLSGQAMSSTGSEGCCIAAFANQCLCLLQSLPACSTHCGLMLSALQTVGVCCCMDPSSVLLPLLDVAKRARLRTLQCRTLSVLGRLLLEHLGGGCRNSCSICSVGDLEKKPPWKHAGVRHSVGLADVFQRWDALQAYKELVFAEDPELSVLVARHVCVLLLQSNWFVQWQLYAHVLHPVLQRGAESAQQQPCHQGLSAEVLQIYLQALLSLLKHRLIRDHFLSSGGLHWVTEMISLDAVRLSALKVFETLILRLEDPKVQDNRESVSENVSGDDSSPVREGVQTPSKFSQGPKEVQGGYVGKLECESHLKAINLFLCVAFLSVSKEVDSDQDSANDSEDTSGYDSTASEPLATRLPCHLSPDSVVAPGWEQMHHVTDVWSTCRCILLSSHTFQMQFAQLGGFEVSYRLMVMVIQKLAFKIKDGMFQKSRKEDKTSSDSIQEASDLEESSDGMDTVRATGEKKSRKLDEEWPKRSIQLFEALLAICLHNAKSSTAKTDTELSVQACTMEEIMTKVGEVLSCSALIGSSCALWLFDSLLCVAVGSVSTQTERTRRWQHAELSVDGDLEEREYVMDTCQTSCPHGGHEGYEADGESDSDTRGVAEKLPVNEALFGSLGCHGYGHLRNPEMCSTMLLLLSSSSPSLSVLCHSLRGILSAVHTNPHNANLLYQQGAVKIILEGFHSLLSQSNSVSEDCQVVLMDLLVTMMKASVTAEELTVFLRLFQESNPPIKLLLRGLLHVVTFIMGTEARYFLSFPLIPSVPSKAVQDSSPPVCIPMLGLNCWPHVSNGFSASLWLRSTTVTGAEKCSVSHLLSFGSRALMLQMWADFTTGMLQFRVCVRPSEDMGTLTLAEVHTPKGLLCVGKWQHVALTYTEDTEDKRSVCGRLVLWVCGVRGYEVSLDYSLPKWTSLSSDNNKSLCVMGPLQCDREDEHWDAATLLLFNGPAVGNPEAFYLYTRGPDFTSVTACRYRMPPAHLHRYVTPEVLLCDELQGLLLNNREVDTTALEESLAVVYSPSTPGFYSLYEPVVRLKGQPKPVALHRMFSVKEVQSLMLRDTQPGQCKSLQSILHTIGGASTFIYLYARVVELSDCEESQALALQALLCLVKHNQHRIHEMERCHGHNLLHQVLIKAKSIVGYHTLKALLDGCLSGSILVRNADGHFHLDHNSSVLLTDVQLLSHILLDWKVWIKAQRGVWEMLLAALELLIGPHHPQQMFNIQQLLRARVVHRFLLTCQVLQEREDLHLTSLSHDVCKSFVKIIQEVLGSPPDLDLLQIIYNFLLAVHPPAYTSVCHTGSNFCFSLHIDGRLYGEKTEPSMLVLRQSSRGGSLVSPVGHTLEHSDEEQSPQEPASPQSPFHLDPDVSMSADTEILQTQCTDEFLSSCESAQTLCASDSHTTIADDAEQSDSAYTHPLSGKQSHSNSSVVFSLTEEYEDNIGQKSEEIGGITESHSTDRCVTGDHLVQVCCDLYKLLGELLLLMPDLMLKDVMDKLVQPEALIVLVNHPHHLIREGVMKLLSAYFSRSTKEQQEKFVKTCGFCLLANQLTRHRATAGVLQVCMQMLLRRPLAAQTQFDPAELHTLGPFQQHCALTLLALVESSVHDCALSHTTLSLLLQLLCACPKVGDVLLDHGLLCVLINTLSSLNNLENRMSQEDYRLLVCDVQHVLVCVTLHCCSSSGPLYFRIIEDLLILLGCLRAGTLQRTREMGVTLQLQVLQEAIKFIMSTVNQESHGLNSKTGPLVQAYAELLSRINCVAGEHASVTLQRTLASESELVQRLQRLVELIVNRLVYIDVTQDVFWNIPYPPEQHINHTECVRSSVDVHRSSFHIYTLQLLIDGLICGPVLGSCRDTFRVQLSRLLVHTLNPGHTLQDRKRVLDIFCDSAHHHILRESINACPENGPKLALYVWETLHHHKHSLTEQEQMAGSLLMASLKMWNHQCVPPTKPEHMKAIREDQLKYESEANASKAAWERNVGNTQKSVMQRLDSRLRDIRRTAADITQTVSLQQGSERKKVMQHIRRLYKLDLNATRHWQELIQQLTHDRAVWYEQTSYATSWQLDPTEGPSRERRRLRRCVLNIPNKYLLADRRKRTELVKAPLSFLFEDKIHSYYSSIVQDRVNSETIRFNRKCIMVAPSTETSGELLLGVSGIYFIEDDSNVVYDRQSYLGETESTSFSWTYEEIKEVHKRWFQLRDNSVEIFLTNGRTLLLAFDDTKSRNTVFQNILASDLPSLLQHGNIDELTKLWTSGHLSNFEYLTHLNKHAGRSFNDLMQYPVFPFILADYTSEALNLQDPSVYRNLMKPIAVQSKEKEERYINNYKYLEEEFIKSSRDEDSMPAVQPYHYGSHYSNSGTVLHFLVRMPPFTKMFLSYQDQSFDIPDRTFHSMSTTWRLSSYESMTDVKELIPEFFYLPEFLLNREGFDFGVRQNGERVNHVNLPAWAHSDPRLFVLIHRQALESHLVSHTLCHWIDLVFGVKQKGRAAVNAINVFHPATYFGVDVSSVEDPVQQCALETMIKTYGQTPRQLFTTSHVCRPRHVETELQGPSPLPWIKGVRWGEYVGSPSTPEPVVCFSQPHGERFGSLLALPTRAICGLAQNFCLMMTYTKEQGVRTTYNTDVQWSAILSWNHMDNVLRLKSKQSEPPLNFIQCSRLHKVTTCAWEPDTCQLLTGSKSGVIAVYAVRITCTTTSEIQVESPVHLYGHSEEVTRLFVCKPYSTIISASRDGTCILWDLNRLCYMQSLAGHKSPITAVCASDTTGDIATVCRSDGGGSDLRLWTINGDLIGHIHCREIICSVTFSNQPEGVAVNVIAAGLENGVVRLWSTWDLKPVRDITFLKSIKPIICLTFSCDGHHLYTANSDGTVMAWCRRDQLRVKLPMLYSFLSSYTPV